MKGKIMNQSRNEAVAKVIDFKVNSYFNKIDMIEKATLATFRHTKKCLICGAKADSYQELLFIEKHDYCNSCAEDVLSDERNANENFDNSRGGDLE